MQNDDFKLNVTLKDKEVVIDVIDIVQSKRDDKEYIVYTIDDLSEQEMFVSILNEKEDSYTLDTIEDDEEFNYVNELLKEASESLGTEDDEQ